MVRMEVDRHTDRALYLQLADVLREAISSGQLQPGQRLPSESALIESHSVSRGTARQAISTLKREGLIVVEHGRGTFVRSKGQAPLVRRVSAAEPLPGARQLFEEQTAKAGRAVSVREITGLTADPRPSELDAEPFLRGRPVRELWLGFADGRPVTLTWAWRVVAEAPRGDSVEERVRARMPTRDERRLLQLDEGAPVIELERILRSHANINELSVGVIAAMRQSLHFVVPAPAGP